MAKPISVRNRPVSANAPRRNGARRCETVWVVRRAPGASAHRGLLAAAGKVWPCALGRSGITVTKREGDGATPAGDLALLGGYFRRDRLPVLAELRGLRAIRPDDGWCDDPAHPAYNRPVDLPFAASHEKMWREDGLYDICLVMDHNFSRRSRNRGSAVFFHLTAGKPYTAGCVAISRKAMMKLLPRLKTGTVMDIRP